MGCGELWSVSDKVWRILGVRGVQVKREIGVLARKNKEAWVFGSLKGERKQMRMMSLSLPRGTVNPRPRSSLQQ